MLFAKENFSNGDIATVDVLYPSAPIFLFFNPRLLHAQLLPVLEYAAMTNHWKFPFAPHDLGQYPLANGQEYGGGEKTEEDQMPVEESGNLLILMDAYERTTADKSLAERFWPQLTQWADYLKANGLNPENQLSTDDFAGHLAHQANLSIKAIDGIAAYANMARTLGHKDVANEYQALAHKMAHQWVDLAKDGDHYKLAFDQPGSWSQKYNLVWDKVMGYELFPKSVRETEIAFYKTKLNQYGLPLDSRKDYTKLDWEVWTATLADHPPTSTPSSTPSTAGPTKPPAASPSPTGTTPKPANRSPSRPAPSSAASSSKPSPTSPSPTNTAPPPRSTLRSSSLTWSSSWQRPGAHSFHSFFVKRTGPAHEVFKPSRTVCPICTLQDIGLQGFTS